MSIHIKKPIKTLRLGHLPESFRATLKNARLERGLSQLELGRLTGLPQMHISGIENGKISPRIDTLLDLVRVLDYDLLLIPKQLVPAVQSLLRDQDQPEEQPLYAVNNDENNEDEPHEEIE